MFKSTKIKKLIASDQVNKEIKLKDLQRLIDGDLSDIGTGIAKGNKIITRHKEVGVFIHKKDEYSLFEISSKLNRGLTPITLDDVRSLSYGTFYLSAPATKALYVEVEHSYLVFHNDLVAKGIVFKTEAAAIAFSERILEKARK